MSLAAVTLFLFRVGRIHGRAQDNVVQLRLGGSYNRLGVREKFRCRWLSGD